MTGNFFALAIVLLLTVKRSVAPENVSVFPGVAIVRKIQSPNSVINRQFYDVSSDYGKNGALRSSGNINSTNVKVIKVRRVFYKKPTTPIPPKSPRNTQVFRRKLARFLSLFTIVKFTNTGCKTPEGYGGTCYHRLECRSLNGRASGTCAAGYGVCCYFEKSCGQRSQQNCTYFVSPPSGEATELLSCIFTIEKTNALVKQIRLDFMEFELLGPTNGTCINDQFIVMGQNLNSIVPVLCGVNDRQHVYVDVDGTSGPVYLSVLTNGQRYDRRFRIKIMQFKEEELLAPKNCLQYYTGVQGTFSSFNYQQFDNATGLTGYMNNLNYAICLRKEQGFCTITYTNAGIDGMEHIFQIPNVNPDGDTLIPPGEAGAEVFNCPDDYIVINGVRLCGERFNDASVDIDFTHNAPVTDRTTGPFIIPFVTNAATTGRGFQLHFKQNPCRT